MKFNSRFMLINKTTGNVCYLFAYQWLGSRSTCYKYRKIMALEFPDCQYVIYKLVEIGGTHE